MLVFLVACVGFAHAEVPIPDSPATPSVSVQSVELPPSLLSAGSAEVVKAVEEIPPAKTPSPPPSPPPPLPPPPPPASIEGPRLIVEPMALDPQRDYARLMRLMSEGHEKEALVSAGDFLRRYPTHPLAALAQFQVAEIFWRRREFQKALVEFQKVNREQQRDPSQRARVVLRLGACHMGLGDRTKAQIEWNAVVRRYPETPEAAEARSLLKGLL